MTCFEPVRLAGLSLPETVPNSAQLGIDQCHNLRRFSARRTRCWVVTCFRDDGLECSSSSGTGRSLARRSQEQLLERIAFEVRKRRNGARESTPLVRSLTWACRRATIPEDVDALVAGLELSLHVFTTTIQKLGMEGKPDAALAILEWVKTRSGRKPNVFTYNSLLGALKETGKWELAEQVYEEMIGTGITPNIVTLNTLINMYELQGAYRKAVSLFRSLKSSGVQPTLFTFRNVLQILRKTGDVETALDVFGEFKHVCGDEGSREGNFELKRSAIQKEQLEVMIRQICLEKLLHLLAGDVSRGQVLRIWNKMKKNRVRLSRNLCERLIQACGDHKLVKVLYLDMRKQNLVTSASLCNAVIRKLGQCKRWWAALEVFEHMSQFGPKPNVFTQKLLLSHFHVLLSSAVKRRIWKWALQLIEKMIQRGVEPDRFSWNAALIACSKAGETDSAIEVFRRMAERGQKPGSLTYGALLSALEKGHQIAGVKMVWEHMRVMGVKPNIYAYTTTISACGRAGCYGEALSLLEEMRVNGVTPTLVTFNALITASARSGDGSRAMNVIEQMKVANVQPDVISYTQLVEALANEGRWGEAIETFNKMRQLQFQPTTQALDAVVRVCRANSVSFSIKKGFIH